MTELSNPIYIKTIEILIKEFPLKTPYQLSFATLDKFISIQTAVSFSNHNEITTEVVPLLGYNEESEQIVLENLKTWTPVITGMSVENARAYIKEKIEQFPFSTSPLLTAIDLLEYPINGINQEDLSYVVPTSTESTAHFKSLLSDTKNVIKVKLTGNVETDTNGLNLVLDELKKYPNKIRFDANQAYNYESARMLFSYLIENQLENKVEYIEQPLPVGKENEMGLLRSEFDSIQIMLDESVVTINDLTLAEKNRIGFIKLKLFKQGGIQELISIAEAAHQKGIQVILGNGVATHISNKIENEIFVKNQHLFLNPLESNGFKKILN